MNCDLCGTHISEDDTFITLPEEIVEVTAMGYVPSNLPSTWAGELTNQGIAEPAEMQAAFAVKWKRVVKENASVDWLLCPNCHLEMVRHRKART